jgi:FkbM family methyltransferase
MTNPNMGTPPLPNGGPKDHLARWTRMVRGGELPRMVRDTAHTVHRKVRVVQRASDLPSRLQMARLVGDSVLRRETTSRTPAATAVPVRVREFGDEVVWLRPRSRDRKSLEYIEERYHLPPAGLTGPVTHIAVFGSYIGLPLLDLAKRYPGARLLGAEPDADNAEVSRRNTAHLGDRCEIAEVAVWHRDEKLDIGWERDGWGVDLSEDSYHGLQEGSATTVDAVSAATLLERFSGGVPVDYVFVNIEGAWYEMLQHGEWTKDVRSIKVEVQSHIDEAVPLLEALGFRARLQRLIWGAYAEGVRP